MKYLFILALFFLFSCQSDRTPPAKATLFTLLSPRESGVDFVNEIQDTEQLNILNYLYFYNGGGVAAGDIDNDGRPDLYFTGNLVPNKLYRNKGNFQFEDITDQAGAGGGTGGWSTGVTMADVNGDGWLDIYVCRVSDFLHLQGANQLFMNNGDGTFTERAAEYGLDHQGFSTQAAFFDYDGDGDLDLYLLNHSVHTERTYGSTALRYERDPRSGDKLFRNDGDSFTDVSAEAGIRGSFIGYGLGIAISDLNQDGWPDLFISNDFHENDYLYLNNGDGTFRESIDQAMGHTSRFSMGNDVADLNNDGLPDVVVMDMRPEHIQTERTSAPEDAYDIYRFKLKYGYHYQYARNTLQLNTPLPPVEAKGPRPVRFQEVGQLAGISATDWSWSALLTDLDNDGQKDLFVTNGIMRRPNDMDYIKYISTREIQESLKAGVSREDLKLIEQMPSVQVPNYAYRNNGDLTFTNQAAAWGLDQPGFSNGAAYADLDGDGFLDLVVNNINQPAFIYRNGGRGLTKNRYLKVKLQGEGKNTAGIGAKVLLQQQGIRLYQEQSPVRGFQSSVEPVLNFGLGNLTVVDSLTVIWPDGRSQLLTEVSADQVLTLWQSEATGALVYGQPAVAPPLLQEITDQLQLNYRHLENDYVDFNQELLMPHMLSTEGPKIATGDVNGDGREDFYVGGAKGAAGKLFLQRKDGSFTSASDPTWQADQEAEDVGALFFDANGDRYLDLYVVSGGNEPAESGQEVPDRLYLNNGKGSFTKASGALPPMAPNGSCVAAADFDGDGHLDLFVGRRAVAGSYGLSPRSYLLRNDGKGRFTDVTEHQAPGLAQVGMVTAATWTDHNGDGKPDLVVVGEWMPVSIFRNTGSGLQEVTEQAGLAGTKGWWNSLLAQDLDGDGDPDLVVGNLGLNSLLKASEQEPARLYIHDFNQDGKTDPILTYYRQGRSYPMATKDDLLAQMVSLRKKYVRYADFSGVGLEDIFAPAQVKDAQVKEAFTFQSSYLENLGDGTFRVKPLPTPAQVAPVYGIAVRDLNGDGHQDLLLAGNFSAVGPYRGRYDASPGLVLTGDGKGNFTPLTPARSGFLAPSDTRDLRWLAGPQGQSYLLVARNNERLQVFRENEVPGEKRLAVESRRGR